MDHREHGEASRPEPPGAGDRDPTGARDAAEARIAAAPQDPAEDFAARLRALREEAGDPSFRTLAKRSGCISHTTLHEATKGNRLPSWETTEQFVLACGQDPGAWRDPWEQASAAIDAAAPTPDPRPASSLAPPPSSSASSSASLVAAPLASETDQARTGVPMIRPVADVPAGPARADRTGAAWARWPEAARRESGLTLAPSPTGRRHGRAALALTLAVLLGLGAGVGLGYLAFHDRTGGGAATAAQERAQSGDAIGQPEDVTLRDGTEVARGTTVTKTWRLSNTGTVAWQERSLSRLTLPDTTGAMCTTPERVPIPATAPGQSVEVDVKIEIPDLPGETCRVEWKMVDSNGTVSFPDGRPLFFYLKIR